MCHNNLLQGTLIICLNILLTRVSLCFDQNVDPYDKTTHGEVWPKPMNQRSYAEYLKFEPKYFRFDVKNDSCHVLQVALKRYTGILFVTAGRGTGTGTSTTPTANVVGTLTKLNVHLMKPCGREDYPSSDMDEKYEIQINSSGGMLIASYVWGILRGLETFSQLVTLDGDGSTFIIRSTSIVDYPKFKHRGLLLDTSRHYLPVRTICKTLDAMSYSKLNVFHWHMVDDDSFPYQSSVFPKLSEKGAYGKEAIYTRDNISLVIEYARLRGIRVIPEFDTPGHTLSWRFGGIPGLLTKCSKSDPSDFGPIDPTVKENYDFIKTLLTEVNGLFKDQHLHLGGDEVEASISCWSSNKRIKEFMRRNKIRNVIELENFYFENIFSITRQLKAVPIVWEELFDANITLHSNVIVHVWKGDFNLTIPRVIKSGHRVLLSSCWYLNYIKYGTDWLNFYRCDPSVIPEVVDNKKDLFLGGEACVWGEFVDETNLLSLSWPRASAVAEVLWSHVLNETEAKLRLEEHVCRMKRRGIPAQPSNGPNYCTY